MRQNRALLTACCIDMSAGAFSAQVQAFRTINPVGFLVVNRPSPGAIGYEYAGNRSVSGFPLFPGYAGLSPDRHTGSASGKRF